MRRYVFRWRFILKALIRGTMLHLQAVYDEIGCTLGDHWSFVVFCVGASYNTVNNPKVELSDFDKRHIEDAFKLYTSHNDDEKKYIVAKYPFDDKVKESIINASTVKCAIEFFRALNPKNKN